MILARSLALHALLAIFVLAGTAKAAPVVVFGNLGASGTGGLSDTNTDFGPSETTQALAQGFTTGTSELFLNVKSISIGAFAISGTSVVPRTISIFSSVANAPGVALYTSGTVLVGDAGVYTFTFDDTFLAPSTNYWVVPQNSDDWSWYLNANEDQPTEQNASGYAYLGTRRLNTTPAWVNTVLPYSVSVIAVPEPATAAPVAIGLVGGVAFVNRSWRRRKSGDAPVTG